MGHLNKGIRLDANHLWLASLIATVFVAYPNNAWLLCEIDLLVPEDGMVKFFAFFFFRFFFFWLLLWSILKYDFTKLSTTRFTAHAGRNLLLTLLGFAIYEFITWFVMKTHDRWISILIFQYIVVWLLSSLISFINTLYEQRRRQDLEIERLKVENLESRCSALTNQINPHFFFNSLNGVSALVRKKNDEHTLNYINELSDIFRYILQSEHKTLVPLEDELRFVKAFSNVMEVRFANKLNFKIDVDEKKCSALQLPVLSLLPLIENVTTHNMIDSEHVMDIRITLNNANELIVENPIYPKLLPASTHGTGLKNLDSRFNLLLNKHIKIEIHKNSYRVVLPLESEL